MSKYATNLVGVEILIITFYIKLEDTVCEWQ